MLWLNMPGHCQGSSFTYTPPITTPPSMPTIPPPMTPPSIPAPIKVFVPITPPPTLGNTPINPIDLTNANPIDFAINAHASGNGISAVNEKHFKEDILKGDGSGILVKWIAGSKFQQLTPYSINFESGSILVSTRRPAHVALIKTKYFDISCQANSEIILKEENDVIHLMNLNGTGKAILVKVPDKSSGLNSQVMSIAPGFEFIGSNTKIATKDLYLHDGFARRGGKLLGNEQFATNEFSLETVLANSGLIVTLGQNDSHSKTKRILADMSKMAAVLNYVNGTTGFYQVSVSKQAKAPSTNQSISYQ